MALLNKQLKNDCVFAFKSLYNTSLSEDMLGLCWDFVADDVTADNVDDIVDAFRKQVLLANRLLNMK